MVLLPGCSCCESCDYAQTPTATMGLYVQGSGAFSAPACPGEPYPNLPFSFSGFTSGNTTFPITHANDFDGSPKSDAEIPIPGVLTVGGVDMPSIEWSLRIYREGLSATRETVYELFIRTFRWGGVLRYRCRPNGPSFTHTNQGQHDKAYELPMGGNNGDSVTYPGSYGSIVLNYGVTQFGTSISLGGKTFGATNSLHFGGDVAAFPIGLYEQFDVVKTCGGTEIFSRPDIVILGFGGMVFPKVMDPGSLLP